LILWLFGCNLPPICMLILCLFGPDFSADLDMISSLLGRDSLPIWMSILRLFGCDFTACLDVDSLVI